MNRSDGRGKGPRRPARKQVSIEFLLLFYEAFLREYEITKIATALETTVGTLQQWIEKFPELKEAKELAESRRKEQSSFSGYVFKHLSPEAKKVWDKITFWSGSDSTNEKIDQILSGQPTKLRQEIFVHALISNAFNLSEACRIACVSRQTVETWRKSDYAFLQMIEEIEWHKRNFFEEALVDLVAMRNPGAVMFVNRTKNADRGYSEKIQIEHSGQIASSVSIDELELPMETRKELLRAVRATKVVDVTDPKQLVEETA